MKLTYQGLNGKKAGRAKYTNANAIDRKDKSGIEFGHFLRLHGIDMN